MPCGWVLQDRSLLTGDTVVMVHRDLPATASAAPAARALLTSILTDHVEALPAYVIWAARLVTSELVTNAVLHVRTGVHLGIAHDDRDVLVVVADGDPVLPAQRTAPVDPSSEEQGRGMTLVAALSKDFGWRLRTDATGKMLWAVLSLAQPTHPRPAARPP